MTDLAPTSPPSSPFWGEATTSPPRPFPYGARGEVTGRPRPRPRPGAGSKKPAKKAAQKPQEMCLLKALEIWLTKHPEFYPDPTDQPRPAKETP